MPPKKLILQKKKDITEPTTPMIIKVAKLDENKQIIKPNISIIKTKQPIIEPIIKPIVKSPNKEEDEDEDDDEDKEDADESDDKEDDDKEDDDKEDEDKDDDGDDDGDEAEPEEDIKEESVETEDIDTENNQVEDIDTVEVATKIEPKQQVDTLIKKEKTKKDKEKEKDTEKEKNKDKEKDKDTTDNKIHNHSKPKTIIASTKIVNTVDMFGDDDLDFRYVMMNYDYTKNVTMPKITKYERALLIGKRAKQIEEGANPNVKYISGQSVISIAEEELRQRKIPLIIKRPIGNKFEYWKPADMEVNMD